MVKEFTIPGGQAQAFKVLKDELVTITDLEGQQVIDFLAFASANHKEYLSMSHTRLSLRRTKFKQGDKLITNLTNPIVEIVEDTVGVHDSMVASCNPGMYRELGVPEHRSCHQNFNDVLKPYGIESWWQPDPFNIFQNTPVHLDGAIKVDTPPSKAGDFIKLRFLVDSLFAVSACPYDFEGFNGGKATPIKISIQAA